MEENELVVLKKKFFVSDTEIDRNDPVQVNLLYHQVHARPSSPIDCATTVADNKHIMYGAWVLQQAQQAIVRGTHPCQRDEAAQLAALQCQVTLGNQSADKTRITLIKSVQKQARRMRVPLPDKQLTLDSLPMLLPRPRGRT